MAFLDNTGDIILDAVLTDEGRKRLAAGDGSFRIVKFALGDDEIDYSLYRNSNNPAGRHASGSAYYDLNILQTPILEAFTNNTSLMNSKLLSYARNDLLYLPVIELNNKSDGGVDRQTANKNAKIRAYAPDGGYVITADKSSATNELAYTSNIGIKDGYRGNNQGASNQVPFLFDEGLDSTNLVVARLADGDPRFENQYLVEVDNRFFKILPAKGNNPTPISPSFIDDDNIASYYLSRNTDSGFFALYGDVNANFPGFLIQNNGAADQSSVLGNPTTNTGRYGSRFGFRLQSSDSIQLSTELFRTLGKTTTNTYGDLAGNFFRVINTTVRVTGYTIGYRTTVPLQIIKKI
jgi:hypothetical protein